MLIEAEAILWRVCNQATYDSLMGESKGQYDIRLGTMDCQSFFLNIPQSNPTIKGGYDLVVPIQPYTGQNPVPQQNITVRFMGMKSIRKDWYIASQRPQTAYPLWRTPRGINGRFNQTPGNRNYLIIIRDKNKAYHARWLKESDIKLIPSNVVGQILKDERGILPL